MSMTDPIADMLTRIRNAIGAGHPSVSIPASKVKSRIAEILRKEGYIESFDMDTSTPQGAINITLKWSNGKAAIEELRRLSRPGQRKYARNGDIPQIRNGLGILIVSTSKGLMTDKIARKEGIGGELICSVW